MFRNHLFTFVLFKVFLLKTFKLHLRYFWEVMCILFPFRYIFSFANNAKIC